MKLASSLRVAAAPIVCAVAFLLANGAVASAATFDVDTTSGLVNAVDQADSATGSSTIVLAGGMQYIPSSTLTFSKTSGTTTVEGPASVSSDYSSQAIIAGSSVSPYPSDLIDIEQGAKVDFKDVAVDNGGGIGGYAAINDFGDVTLEDSALVGNVGFGLLVEEYANASVTNSTIGEGDDFGVVDQGELSLASSTVAYNDGGIDDSVGVLRLENSIVAENTDGGQFPDCSAPPALDGGSVDRSLDSDGTCGAPAGLSGVNPDLQNSFRAPILDGGTTPLYPLEPGSPAIGAGDASNCPTSDQRGYSARVPCDLGSYQSGGVPPPTATGGGSVSPGGGQTGSGTTGSVAIDRGVRGHGRLAGHGRRVITFSASVREGQHTGTFVYADPASALRIELLRVTAVTIDQARDTATVRGIALDRGDGRHVRLVARFDCAAGLRSLHITLSTGYSHQGRLMHGSLSLTP